MEIKKDVITEEIEEIETEVPADDSFTTGQQVFIDALISKTIQKERSAFEKRKTDIQAEAERVAKMNADEKASHERAKQEASLQAREMEISKREARAFVVEALGEAGHPKSLADLVDYQNQAESLETLLSAFTQAVTAKVNEQMRQTPPETSIGQVMEMNPWHKDTWNFTKQNELLKNNPREAKRLQGLGE